LDSKPIYVALAQRKEARKAQLQALRQNKSHLMSQGGPPIYSGPASAAGGPPPVYYQPPPQTQPLPPQSFLYPQMIHQPRGGRAWQASGNPQNQYQPYNVANINRGPRHHRGQQGQGNAPQNYNRGGGRFHNGSRGGGHSRGGDNVQANAEYQQNVSYQKSQENVPPPQPQGSVPSEQPLENELTIDALEQLPKDERVALIGEHLFPLVTKVLVAKRLDTNEELAGKITGMFIHNLEHGNSSYEELVNLVHDNDALDTKITEAISVLEANARGQVDRP